MKYFSTRNKNERASFKEAVLKGIADDGGLFFPAEIPRLSASFFNGLSRLSFREIAFTVAKNFVDPIPASQLQNIIERSFDFEVPLQRLSDQLSVLELFHGPTLAFKDFGARFLANILEYYIKDSDKETVVLVATSGDTGSAVANAFMGKDGIRVGLLYPSGKVSKIQEQQLTTMGGNVKAFEVQGNFDDCQKLVKRAFLDPGLRENFNLTSANSINMARLLPQSFYYFWAWTQRLDPSKPSIFSVPSGNFGNLCAGLLAAKMGLPVHTFIAANNRNRFFTDYLKSGKTEAKAAIHTLSNAMDVGNPSNFPRILSLFENDPAKLKSTVEGYNISDEETLSGIRNIYQKYHYIMDPHGAVGYCSAIHWLEQNRSRAQAIILETAHPAKFYETVKEAIQVDFSIPTRLAFCLDKEKQALPVSRNFRDFKEALIQTFL